MCVTTRVQIQGGGGGYLARDENEKHGLRFFRREKRTNVGRID